jgi:hypothetical protein
MKIRINLGTLLAALLFAGMIFGCIWWAHTPPNKAHLVQPLLAEMDAYRATNGAYATSYASFGSFSKLAQRYRVYTGERDTNGVTWETREVSGHDFTVLSDPSGYEVFLPVGRMKLISFSSFPVWRFASAEHRWQKGRIHWSLLGSYWSDD